jgi:hypothetical protein
MMMDGDEIDDDDEMFNPLYLVFVHIITIVVEAIWVGSNN